MSATWIDSVEMDEITVNTITTRKVVPSMNATVIQKKQIERRFESSLLPILTEEVPGLFITGRGIMGYGVANGAAGGMKIRGVGGAPTSAMLVLIDGHPQYMGLMGHPLPDSYQAMMTERVEVIRGPASTLYGSNAMGGVINITTKKQIQDGVQTLARFMYGSFNTLNTEVNNAIRNGKFSSFVSLNYNRTDGHRHNMEFGQWNGYLKLGYDFNPHWQAFADLNLTRFSASNPGSVNQPLEDNDAWITRGMTSFSLENNYEKGSGALKFYYNFGQHDIDEGYAPGAKPLDYRFRSNDRMLGITAYQFYRFFTGNQIRIGMDYQRFGGKAWNHFADHNTELVDKHLNDIAGYLDIDQNLTYKLLLNAGIRIDHNTHSGTEWIPQVSIRYIPWRQTVIAMKVSKGFRNPTIREMYMFPPQNPDLRPERLMNYELSLNQELFENWPHQLNLQLNIYYIHGENTIQTLFVQGRPLNVNTGKIENYGVEFATQFRVNQWLGFSANYSWLQMEYKVVAAPEHKLYLGINLTPARWSLSTGFQYIHNLYTSVKPITTQSFILWNLRVSWQASKRVELFARGENLLAQEYEILAGYPMPRATAYGGLNLKF